MLATDESRRRSGRHLRRVELWRRRAPSRVDSGVEAKRLVRAIGARASFRESSRPWSGW
jgi:hypothetical protein